jgi:UPF0755 protein
MKRFIAVTGALLIAACFAALLVSQQYHRFLDTALMLPAEGYVLQIDPGTTGSSIIKRLASAGFTRESWQWKLLMRLEPPGVKVGEYQLEPGLQPRSLLQLLASGAVIQYRFTLVEGWTFTQLLQVLSADPVLEHTLHQDTAEATTDIVSRLHIDHPEGWFFPETYQFTRSDSDFEILARAHNAMKTALESAWQARNTGLPLDSPYELLILASIIEKETAIDDERARVAGVFIRRLQKGMRLQTDPTVIYGMGDSFDGNIRRRDLQTDTPYNSYTRSGLPPTPIAMPGRASLFAAGQPDDGEALYFVADGNGGHTFSATLEEHQKAVNKLIGKN